MHYRQIEDYDYPDDEELLDRDVYAEEQRQPSWIRYNTNINACSCLKSSNYSQHKFQKTYYISSTSLNNNN